ncbi:hypothetical protein ACWGH2_13370, partial [Streptomyces sp. NPDC054871]
MEVSWGCGNAVSFVRGYSAFPPSRRFDGTGGAADVPRGGGDAGDSVRGAALPRGHCSPTTAHHRSNRALDGTG